MISETCLSSLKKCLKCGVEKDITLFYREKQSKDGRRNQCISCRKQYNQSIMNDPDFLDRIRASRRKSAIKNRKNSVSKLTSKSSEKYRLKYPEKIKAITAARVVKSLSEEKHHWSYNEEHRTDVIHFTRKEHLKGHRFITYDQDKMMYRTLDGVLLDTKQKHIEYIMEKIQNEPD